MDKIEECLMALLPRLTDEEKVAFIAIIAGCAVESSAALDVACRLAKEAERLCAPAAESQTVHDCVVVHYEPEKV